MLISLSPDEIDLEDKRFSISYPLSDPLLFSSIKELGLLQPPILLNRKPFIILSGFKRVEILLKLGFNKIPALIFDLEEDKACLIPIHENIKRGLNLVEKAHALRMLEKRGFNRERLFEIMKILDLQPAEKVLQLLLKLSEAEDDLKSFVVSRKITKKNLEDLFFFERKEREKILEILESMHLTEATLSYILRMLMILKVKMGFLDLNGLKGVKEVEELKGRLKNLLFPKLSSLFKSFKEKRDSISLPPYIKLSLDPYFERDFIEIILRVKRLEELDEAIKRLTASREKLGEILELTSGIC